MRRTGLETARARSALIDARRVGLELGVREHLTEEQHPGDVAQTLHPAARGHLPGDERGQGDQPVAGQPDEGAYDGPVRAERCWIVGHGGTLTDPVAHHNATGPS